MILGNKQTHLDTYLSLCTEVYDLSKPNPPEDAYHFYRKYVKAAKGPILEPMCGTGRFLLSLLEEGFDIRGFDASQHMIAALHQKAKLKNLNPNVWHGFAQDFDRDEKYDLIFIPSGSFCLITDETEAVASLKAFYHCLTESGVLLLEIETIKGIPELGSWRGSIWPKSDETTILLSQLVTMDSDICKSLGKYELISDNKIIHTEIETYKIRIYEQDVLTNMLRSSGFKNIRMVKAFDSHQKPTCNDESIIYECGK
jgi:SAM-dependent methyltransferase